MGRGVHRPQEMKQTTPRPWQTLVMMACRSYGNVGGGALTTERG